MKVKHFYCVSLKNFTAQNWRAVRGRNGHSNRPDQVHQSSERDERQDHRVQIREQLLGVYARTNRQIVSQQLRDSHRYNLLL